MHPFAEDTSNMSVQQLYDRVAELTNKYFATQNPQVRDQISTFIELYRQEAMMKEARNQVEEQRVKELLRQQNQDNDENSLDNLINIS